MRTQKTVSVCPLAGWPSLAVSTHIQNSLDNINRQMPGLCHIVAFDHLPNTSGRRSFSVSKDAACRKKREIAWTQDTYCCAIVYLSKATYKSKWRDIDMLCFTIWIVFVFFLFAALALCTAPRVRDRDMEPACSNVVRSTETTGGYASPSCTLRLVCVSGPLTGQSYALGPSARSIGTAPSHMIRLPAGTPGISRRHCCVSWKNSAPQLTDLGSSYGTFLCDGRKLPPQNPTELSIGSRFYLGNTGCMFQISAG